MNPNTYGDWEKAFKILNGMPDLVRRNMERATKRNGQDLRDEIKCTIRDTDPSWPELKAETKKRKGSSKPLIDKGDLLASIKDWFINPFLGFVGVKKGVKGREGQDMVNIGAVHEFGSEKANIPQRSFIRSTFERIKERLWQRYVDAAKDAIYGVMYRG